MVWQPWSGNPVSLERDAFRILPVAAAALTEERPSCVFVLASQKKKCFHLAPLRAFNQFHNLCTHILDADHSGRTVYDTNRLRPLEH
jgi:hypothetical protein